MLGRFFGGPASGASFMTAGLILAVMIIPIITSISREVLTTVAQDDKNAALAMGATRWEMLRVAVFPRVRSGLVGAVDARARARDGRDDRGRAGDRRAATRSRRTCSARATRWPR